MARIHNKSHCQTGRGQHRISVSILPEQRSNCSGDPKATRGERSHKAQRGRSCLRRSTVASFCTARNYIGGGRKAHSLTPFTQSPVRRVAALNTPTEFPLQSGGDCWYLERRGATKLKGVPDAEIAVFISRVIIHAVIHAAAVERPGLLTTPLLTDELVALLEGYLQRRA
jgi:hypothetical protein